MDIMPPQTPPDMSQEADHTSSYTLHLKCEGDQHFFSVNDEEPQPVDSFEDGLKRMVQYYQEHQQTDDSPEAEHNAAYKQEEQKIGGRMPRPAGSPY